jgi:hypothetical protein
MSTTTAPNAWCLIHGTPGTDPLTIEGPFETEEEATANMEADQKAAPDVPVMIDVLVNPANC